MSPARRRAGIKHVVETLGVSEWFACRVIGQHRTTQRLIPKTADDEDEDEAALTADIIELARQYGCYGYRRITALLHQAGGAAFKVPVTRNVAGRAAEGGPLTRSVWFAFGAVKG